MPRKKDVAVGWKLVGRKWKGGPANVRQRIMKVANEEALLPQAMVGCIRWFLGKGWCVRDEL